MSVKKGVKKTYSIKVVGNTIVCTYHDNLKGKDNIERARMIQADFERIFTKNKRKKYYAIADTRKLNNTNKVPRESRKVLVNLFKSTQVKKFVGVGGTIYLRTIGNFVARMTGRTKQFCWCKTMKEAQHFLKQS